MGAMRAIVAVADLLTRSRIEDAGRAAGYEVTSTRTLPEPEDADLLVVDLDQEGSLDAVGRWRASRPETRVLGFAFHVNEDVIGRAKKLGVTVHPHGATARASQFFA